MNEWMNDSAAVEYLNEHHGFNVVTQTLRDWRYRDVGPRYRKCGFAKNAPVVMHRTWLDEFAARRDRHPGG